MTYHVRFTDVATAISGITITGITMHDLTNIGANVILQTPTFMPRPERFITNFSISKPETYGAAGVEKLTLDYVLNYTYFHAPIGASVDFGIYNTMISNVASIVAAAMALDSSTGAQDLRVNTVADSGWVVLDPAGNSYHGCGISFRIKQFAEV